jgi:hypothetical protein
MRRRSTPDIAVEFQPLTESQIELLTRLGKREAELIDQLEAAVRSGDRDLCWQIAQALCGVEDQARKVKE